MEPQGGTGEFPNENTRFSQPPHKEPDNPVGSPPVSDDPMPLAEGDGPGPAKAAPAAKPSAGMAALTLGALGVVFGDIGTSPLYALQTVFAADHHAIKPTEAGVYGVISLIFWSITLIVSVKYVTFI